jgi:hypothetical protein
MTRCAIPKELRLALFSRDYNSLRITETNVYPAITIPKEFKMEVSFEVFTIPKDL